MRFLFSVNVYVSIPMVLFSRLKIFKNCQKWVYMKWVRFFSLGFKNLAQRAAKYTAANFLRCQVLSRLAALEVTCVLSLLC